MDYVFHVLQARNKIFPFLQIPAIYLIKSTNDGLVFQYFWKFKIMHLTMFWKITQSYIWVTITLMSTVPYSSVIIDVDSWSVVITLTLSVTLQLKKTSP